MKQDKSLFKWRHSEPSLILSCLRRHCRHRLPYRDLAEMMRERGLDADHSTVFRRARRYAPGIDERIRPHPKMSGTSYRVGETRIEVGETRKHPYRAVDKEGSTIGLMPGAERDVPAARRFFKKVMRADGRLLPSSIGVDKDAAYPEAFSAPRGERIARRAAGCGG